MKALLTSHYARIEASCLDSTLETTRVYWRRKIEEELK